MVAFASSDLTKIDARHAPSPGDQASAPESVIPTWVDFAHVEGKQLLVYGWLLGFADFAGAAVIHFGNIAVDLVKEGVRIRRPDVAQHFSMESRNDEHGFYVLIDMLEAPAVSDHLRLTATSPSGRTSETRWPVYGHNALDASALQSYATTLKRLVRVLSRQDTKRLIEFVRPVLPLQIAVELPTALPSSVRFEVELCCVLAERIFLVYGWMYDPASELKAIQLRMGESVFDFAVNMVPITRQDINADPTLYRWKQAARLSGFLLAEAVPVYSSQSLEAVFSIGIGAETIRLAYPVCFNPQEARQDLLALLRKMDPDSVLELTEHLAASLGNSSEEHSLCSLFQLHHDHAVERLPSAIHHSKPRYFLHVDRAIPVADEGIFLAGWFNAEPAVSARIVCHCGFATFTLSDHWIRHVRTDVTLHLANMGIQAASQEHGYCCYIPFKDDGTPCYLTIVPESGDLCRMRVTAEKSESALQNVRALLTSFSCQDSELLALMECGLGSAVGAAWASRLKPSLRPTIQSFGGRPSDPVVSLIVPLFGRHDFVEYQMALFADDPEFQRVELIYVVDDPAIFHEFFSLCTDIQAIYQVPFVVAFPGVNLGFAGANNFASEIARGKYLLLANSDVLPKRPGWVGDLLRIYASLPHPGLLGAKLLYEDGSVQHAGMAFRRHWPWGGLWINDHPLKGQSPLGLNGVREVDAVTAACALVEASLYRELGGFSEDYIIGDFEDSDLCLRAAALGRRSCVALDVELYHLERQSQNRIGDAVLRSNLTAYNCWLHNRRWANFIEKIERSDPLQWVGNVGEVKPLSNSGNTGALKGTHE